MIRSTFEEHLGVPMAPWLVQKLKDTVARLAIKAMDFVYLNIGMPVRVPLFLSDAELLRIKQAASPEEGKGWVSTQEALCAFLLCNLGQMKADASGVRPSKPGAIRLFRDARSLMQCKPNHVLGIGFWIQVADEQRGTREHNVHALLMGVLPEHNFFHLSLIALLCV